MPSSAWGDCYRRRPRRSRWPDHLRIAHRIDVKGLGTYELHFVAENAVKDHGCREIWIFRAKPVVGVCLYPYSDIIQADDDHAGQSVESIVDATDEHIKHTP